MRFNAPPSIRHYHLPGREWSYITGWSPRVSIRANNDDENRAYLKFWRSFMIEYSSLASPGRRREASVRKQKRRKRESRGGGRERESIRLEEERREGDEPKWESKQCVEPCRRGDQKSHHTAMKNGCWFSKSADLLESGAMAPFAFVSIFSLL